MLPVPAEAPNAAASFRVNIDALIGQFDLSPFAISRALRQLRELEPIPFQEAALGAIAGLPESSGTRFIATLVILNEPVLELIVNPAAFEAERARRIVQAIRRTDSQTEAKLLRLISANPARPLPQAVTDRILDIVDSVSEGPRLVPVLMQIYRSANAHLRARLALSIGRHHRNKDWLEDRMRDIDPRVRANAVEANWNQTDDAALTLFNSALRDPHHRVVGNGAVGLYNVGDIRSLRVFGELLGHPEPSWRATGLWVVGHLHELRFQSRVEALAGDSDLCVRRAYTVASAQLKRIADLRAEQTKLRLRLIKVTRQVLDGTPARCHTHVFLEVKQPEGGSAIPGLKALRFHVFENAEGILDYTVQERTSYNTRGAYDIYFSSEAMASNAAVRHLQIYVLTDTAIGEENSYDFGGTAPTKVEAEPPIEPVATTWNVFR